jgi:hypothetical protein
MLPARSISPEAGSSPHRIKAASSAADISIQAAMVHRSLSVNLPASVSRHLAGKSKKEVPRSTPLSAFPSSPICRTLLFSYILSRENVPQNDKITFIML